MPSNIGRNGAEGGWGGKSTAMMRSLALHSSDARCPSGRAPPRSALQPKQINEIKDFLLTARRKDARGMSALERACVRACGKACWAGLLISLLLRARVRSLSWLPHHARACCVSLLGCFGARGVTVAERCRVARA